MRCTKYSVFWNIFLALSWIGIVVIDARILPKLNDYDGPVRYAVILSLWAAFLLFAFWIVSAKSGFSKCACLCGGCGGSGGSGESGGSDKFKCDCGWWLQGKVFIIAIFGFTFVAVLLVPAVVSKKDLLEEDSPQYDPPQYDSPGPECATYSKAAVASSSKTCSDIGSSVMENDDGNAIDAAIATELCLGVVEFQSSGIGGGGYLVVYNKSSKSSTAVDFRCQASSHATESMLNDIKMSAYPGKFVAVPGELRALEYMWKNFGSGHVTWKKLFEPAISLAENGFRVSKDLESAIQILSVGDPKDGDFSYLDNDVEEFSPLIELVKPGGILLQEGTEIIRPQLAKTLRGVAEHGSNHFYSALATTLVDDLGSNKVLTTSDFYDYEIQRKDVTIGDIQGNTLYGVPLPASGIIQQLINNILEGFGMTSSDKAKSTSFHRFIESLKFGYAGRNVLGDPAKDNLPKEDHSSVSYMAEYIGQKRTANLADYSSADSYDSAATTHIAVFDQDGNSVSMTTSIGINFGSKILSKSTGVLLNGDMTAFSFGESGKTYGLPQSPKNFIEGGKRPMSSMCPSILVDQDGNAKLAIGGAGGSRIISGVALSLVRHLIFDTNICDAVNDPRLHNQLVPNKVYLEEGFSKAIEESLSVEHGHDCIRGMLGEATKPTAVHAVARESSGKLVAVCDKRLSGKPSGF
ncbi:glutathione hydrolase 1 proenzyme-like [Oscarella lobularis]|uniref:glutathione hydrolase 1 proenzyme-like n=1 Tax=Oscarella lobularis TaxID=121494 RepID=UPI003313C2F1